MIQSGTLASARKTISARWFLSGDSPRRFQIHPSAKKMKPVQAIGVCHDQKGSSFASMPASEIAMIPRPTNAEAGKRRLMGVRSLQLAHGDEHVVAVSPDEHEDRLPGLRLLQL